jgi:hypothetical protein
MPITLTTATLSVSAILNGMLISQYLLILDG